SARVETDEELVTAETQSARARALDKRLTDLTQQLLDSGDGLRVEELEAETKDVDIDSLGGRLATLNAALQALRGNRDAQRDEVKRLEMEAAAFDGSSKAAEAAEEAEATLARITVDAERYLELRLASLILTQHIEQYRQAHQAPVLAQAAEHFTRLTLGSFSGLRDDLDDKGKPILLGLRPRGQDVAVEGMSEGSRDQLYLALRLATLEERWRESEPLPLIVDDILVGFDDARSRAALEVLAEIATKAQVILFTHHERLVDLAKDLPTERGVFVHRI
ncbi:MAG: chromosome segregation protein SMC, partial [Deltaproteobacteria bacterium]|nr:chromosome segregation protein SMC [Deltaproteobacteria bacterium]